MSELFTEQDDGHAEDDSGGQDNQFVTFELAGEMFAVPMGPVQEIIRVPDVARLPLAPSTLDGLANLRGRVLPLINLRRLFGCEERSNDDSTRAVVINLGQPLGFVVDRVASVMGVEPGQIEPAASIRSIVAADFITGVIRQESVAHGAQLLLVLDFARLIEQEFSKVAEAARQRGFEQGETRIDADRLDDDMDDDTADSEELRLVSFSVAGQEYAVDIAHVHEIVQLPESITALPHTAGHVLGVISLRQRLLPLVSLRSLFGLPALAAQEQHRIVVIALPGGAQVGLVTDAVKEVLSVPRALAEPMPALLAREQSMQEFSGICRLEDGKRLVSIINTGHLLGLGDIRSAMQHAQAQTHDEDDDMATARRNDDSSTSRDDDDTQVVIFRLGDEEFGVPIMSVQEIVRVPDSLTKVPRTPRFVEGVINLRGTVLPVIDQRTRLSMPAIRRNDRQRIMVYLLGGVRTGFIVDSVAEVLRIPRTQIDPAPDLSDEQGRLITRVAKLDGDRRLVMLIDPSQLLQSREMQDMDQWSQPGGATGASHDVDEMPLKHAA